MISLGDNLLPYGGELYYIENVFDRDTSEDYFNKLFTTIRWKQEPIKIFGREIMQPRLTAWYGESSYTYSGVTMQPLPWFAPLSAIKSVADQCSGAVSNSALLNLYRDGKDYMGWHRDNERSLGVSPVIASVSFGAKRVFQVRDYANKNNLISLEPGSGSLVIMRGDSQRFWEHRVPKTAKPVGARINITFRVIYS